MRAMSRKLTAARVAAGHSETEVAERMGTRQSEVSRIEGAADKCNGDQREKHGVTIDWVFISIPSTCMTLLMA